MLRVVAKQFLHVSVAQLDRAMEPKAELSGVADEGATDRQHSNLKSKIQVLLASFVSVAQLDRATAF